MSHAWTDAQAERARVVCGSFRRGALHDVASYLTRELGFPVSVDALNALFKRRRWGAPSRWCEDGDLSFRLAPESLAALDFDSEPDTTPHMRRPTPPPAEPPPDACRIHVDHEPEPVPLDRRRFTVAVASDLHFGSEYIRRGALRDFAAEAHRRGIPKVLVPGDILDGFYDRHGKFQLSHVGITAQARDLEQNLPRFDGLTYDAILGNHDETYADMAGLDVGEYLGLKLREAGRDDIRFHGEREAYLRVLGTEFCLWHPRGSFSLAQMRKQVLGFKPGTDPRFLLVGHWHHFDTVKVGRCLAIACPSFQGGGSPFGKSLAGHTTVGGFFLSWELDAAGEVHSVGIERREYPEPVTARVVNVA